MIVVQTSTSVVAEHELDHRVLQLAFAHLAVGDADPGVRGQFLDLPGLLLDGLDAVVQEEHLALAVQLAVDRLADQLLVVGRDAGDDAPAVQRRGRQRADVAQAQHRHVQRARNRRGRHRQDVHVDPHAFEPLLVLDAEPLLLVDDQQAQVLEGHVAAEEPMRADQDIHLALRASA